MTMRFELEKILREATGLGSFRLTRPKNDDFGHFSTAVAFDVAREKKIAAKGIAEELAVLIKSRAKGNIFSKIEIAGDGFLNFWLHDDFLLDRLRNVLKNLKNWGGDKSGRGKTVVIDYFGPNVAKLPHVGHLRSAVIGDALKRMFLTKGYKAVSDSHMGDWGTQFGILLYGFKRLSSEKKRNVRDRGLLGLNELYVQESKEIEAEPTRRDLAKEEFAKLERGDRENREIWKWMVDVSMAKFSEIIKKLNLLKFEEHRGESVYESGMMEVVRLALKSGVAIKKNDGAVVTDLVEEGLDEAVLIKSDGASTYLLRDLATIQYRIKKWRYDENLYVVDTRQSFYFKQVFRVAEKLGFSRGKNEFVDFGFMSLPEGAMSSRKGNVVELEEVIGGVIERAREVIREKNPDLVRPDETARMVGIGALKYFDLSHFRKSNIVFDKEKSLSFDGNTGPYIQYTNVRLLSILRKAKGARGKVVREALNSDEAKLLFEALSLPDVLDDALRERSPNIMANYLHSLSQRVNEWYHLYPVLQENDRSKRNFRLGLAEFVSGTITAGLKVLGIEAPKEM